MADISVKDIFKRYSRDPISIARGVVDRIEASVGQDYVPADPTTPYAVSIECAIASGSAILEHIDSSMQEMYRNMAQTPKQLYRHLSDVDFIDIFGQPSINNFYLQFNLEEVQALAVTTNAATNSKLLTIPAGSVFSVGAIPFTLLYPIEIRFRGRSINVVYDTNITTPLQTLETNVVSWKAVEIESDVYLQLIIPMHQLQVVKKQIKTSAMTVLSESFTFDKQFHFALVYQVDANGNRTPVTTTLSDYSFEPTELTALLRVEGNTLSVYIPPVYFSNQMVGETLEVEIYTTEGPLVSGFDQHAESNFSIVWDRDAIAKNTYSAPLTRMTIRRVLSAGLVRTGRVALSFDELRDRAVNGTLRIQNRPITGAELEDGTEDRGFKLVKSVDTITRRIYQATRRLPAPESSITVSGIGARIGVVSAAIDELADLGVVWDNGERVTLSPNTLYNSNNSIIKPLHIDYPDSIAQLPPDALVSNIMENNYLYSPFHYVLDTTLDTFETRAYYLNEPVVENGYHVSDNETTGFVVSLISAGIEKLSEGYVITLFTVSNEAFREVDPTQLYFLLSFTPKGESAQAHVLGEYVTTINNPESTYDGEFIFRFVIDSNFDIDVNNNIVITSAKVFDTDTSLNLPTGLSTEFDLRLGILGFESPTAQPTPIALEMPRFFLDDENETLMDIAHDRISVKFGDALDGLWAESRTTITENDYLKHAEDVYDVYTEDIYRRIPGTNAIETQVVGGQITYVIEHHAGDYKLDVNGNRRIKFLAGTNVLDEFERPIVAQPRKLQCELNLFLLDGAYYFATEEASVQYRDEVVGSLIEWLETDIAYLRGRLMPNTELFYYPQTTIGRVSAILDGENKENIDSEQQFIVRLIVDKTVYDNDKLRKRLEQLIKSIITTVLDSQQVSLSEMIEQLEQELKDHVLGVNVFGLAGEFNGTYVSTGDESQRLTIGKRLIVRADGKLAIEDDIEFNWIQNKTQ